MRRTLFDTMTRPGLWALARAAEAAKTASEIAKLAVESGDRPGAGLEAVREEVIKRTRETLGIEDVDETIAHRIASRMERQAEPDTAAQLASLRARASELLAKSSEPDIDEEVHPAFAAILEQLSPDEARIVGFIAKRGEQPVVDLLSVNTLGRHSHLELARLSMLGPRAGCRHPDRSPEYIDNLIRLGMLRLRDEQSSDEAEYELAEIQTAAADRIEEMQASGRRAKFERHSIDLTDFGQRLVSACFPTHVLPG